MKIMFGRSLKGGEMPPLDVLVIWREILTGGIKIVKKYGNFDFLPRKEILFPLLLKSLWTSLDIPCTTYI